MPTIVIGDFNDLIDAPCFVPLIEVGLRDAMSEIPSVGDESATYHGFRGTRDGARIDHILVSPDFKILSASIAYNRDSRLLASDHWPIVARLLRKDLSS